MKELRWRVNAASSAIVFHFAVQVPILYWLLVAVCEWIECFDTSHLSVPMTWTF